jgi:hypothetical protein
MTVQASLSMIKRMYELYPRALVRWNQNPSPDMIPILQSAQPLSQYPGRITYLECRQIEQFVDHSKACKVQIQTQPMPSPLPTPLQRKRKHCPGTQPQHRTFHLARPSLASAHSILYGAVGKAWLTWWLSWVGPASRLCTAGHVDGWEQRRRVETLHSQRPSNVHPFTYSLTRSPSPIYSDTQSQGPTHH